MECSIDAEIVVAYTQCQTKAFYLLCSENRKEPHQYISCLQEQAIKHKERYINMVKQTRTDVALYSSDDLTQGKNILLEAYLCYEDLQSYADVLTRVDNLSGKKKYMWYEPTLIVGTHSISKDQKLHLSFVGYILSKLLDTPVCTGILVSIEQNTHHVKLESLYPEIELILKDLRTWASALQPSPPPLMLNKQCPYCPFQGECQEKAEEKDDLSLLGGMTTKTIQKYHKKGIFTITQLSYLFRPRKARKKKPKAHTHYRPEVQALALRTEKIYIQELPDISRHQVEIFLDIEGVPDQEFYYLIGIIIHNATEHSYRFFWANSKNDEQHMWSSFLKKLQEYPTAPIYHYGNYDAQALRRLKRRYGNNSDMIQERLVNVNSFIYGKVYFPVRSNTLKKLGKFIGTSWNHPKASGLQSLVWRYCWERDQDEQQKQWLIAYNEEDCNALWLLMEKLSEIIATADSKWNIDFTDQPKKHSTDIGSRIHEELEQVLQYAHADYKCNKISLTSQETNDNGEEKQKKKEKTHAYLRIPSKPTKVIRVPRRRTCPRCKRPLEATEKMGEITIIDLIFTQNGCRKTVIKYLGKKGYCRRCHTYYTPKTIKDFGGKTFGHAFIAWTVYHRIILRLPYHIIPEVMEATFGEKTSKSAIVGFIRYFAHYYSDTEQLLVQSILASPFVHVDETKISVQGENQYVWGFTDGKHVILRKTATREATIVHEFLTGYTGIVISDFYPGYDSLPCRQQKCLAHLIRDINDDLWNEPFNREFEQFVLAVKNLLVPILQAAQKYGLKKRHFNKFGKAVESFYQQHIEDQVYTFEVTVKYQNRFQRYRGSLFTFLEEDGISWNNNMAERAIRHLAVQRKISGSFYDGLVAEYLLLLGIAQTCRFQKKSFLKFLVSQEKDVDAFKVPKAKKYSKAVEVTKKSSKNM